MRPRLVVRFAAPITAAPEPDRAGQSSGVHIIDQYLAANYHQVAKFAYYEILARNELMRLAYVLERYPELSQTFVEDELRELVRAGDGVEVLALRAG